jgi:hypothetical protein
MEEKKYHDKRITNWVVGTLTVVACSSNKNHQSVTQPATPQIYILNRIQEIMPNF